VKGRPQQLLSLKAREQSGLTFCDPQICQESLMYCPSNLCFTCSVPSAVTPDIGLRKRRGIGPNPKVPDVIAVAASTQNQARAALLFLYPQDLGIELP